MEDKPELIQHIEDGLTGGSYSSSQTNLTLSGYAVQTEGTLPRDRYLITHEAYRDTGAEGNHPRVYLQEHRLSYNEGGHEASLCLSYVVYKIGEKNVEVVEATYREGSNGNLDVSLDVFVSEDVSTQDTTPQRQGIFADETHFNRLLLMLGNIPKDALGFMCGLYLGKVLTAKEELQWSI